MANTPNIPSVVVTIEDRSYLQPILASGRTVLMPHFSKYGSEEMQSWSTWEEYQQKFGNADPKKYGLAQLYIKGASQFTQSFIGKRLLPDDATYANTFISFDTTSATPSSLANQIDKDGLISSVAANALGFIGKGRGEGYNDIVLKFEPLREYEKFYADDDGLEKYKFNILRAKIYERQSDGSLVQVEKNPIPFALVSDDPATNIAIKDIYDGKSLNIENRFYDQSNYIDAFEKTNPGDMTTLLGINDLGSPIFWDATKEQAAYISFEDGELAPYYINRPINDTVPHIRIHWIDSTSTDKYGFISIDNGQIKYVDDSGAGAQPGDVDYFNIFGEKAFYKITLTDNGNFVFANVPATVDTYVGSAREGQIAVETTFVCTGAAVIVNDYVMKESVDYVVDTTNSQKIIFTKPLNYGDEILVISTNSSTAPAMVVDPIFFPRFNLWKYLVTEEIQLFNGTSGTNLFINGELNFDGPSAPGQQNAKQLIIDFYMNDSSIREVLYPAYDFDYVPDVTNDPDVQAAIVNLTDYIQTAFGIHSEGIHYSYDQDIKYRKNSLGISSFNNALYSGQANRKHYDSDLGKTIAMPSSYYALLSHLYVDATYDLAEPVANINKGALRTGTIELTYKPTAKEIEKLRTRQINAIIDEPEGIYFIDQLTMYKRASILSRIHAIKPIQKIKKDLRDLLKEVLHYKNGYQAVTRAQTIIDTYMKKWVYSDDNRKGAFQYYKASVNFDENTLTLDVLLTVKPLRSVEKVNVTIAVV